MHWKVVISIQERDAESLWIAEMETSDLCSAVVKKANKMFGINRKRTENKEKYHYAVCMMMLCT